MIKHSLIVTTYNRPDALDLVLKKIADQSIKPFEVIVADDGSASDTRIIIEKYNSKIPNLIHVWQEDKGFRLARIRNLAIIKSTGDFISMIDGDMVLHPDFIKDIQSHIKENFYLQGKRVLLSEETTNKLINNHDYHLHFFSSRIKNRFNTLSIPLLSKLISRKFNSIQSVKGCSMHFWKQDAIKINGFNEGFVGWGREDSEFLCRLLNSGVQRRNIALGAVAFHLYHQEAQRTMLTTNDIILNECIKFKKTWCEEGIEKSQSTL
jgi:glycosyltransferase involved in cell wall biosynthesis